ncbi:RDD family protein [Mucilaginibacter sp. JRF]|uniref:RDD family protein n=1 Tax=Mucilaginibacter sp. JRF TaxID=2780088 RepID=UPI001882709D|nr:RDD family protein [Mucilaginibacter sp. JRF]MBE9585333.1 RDD family protein [Mucilaginibacter sp. JRF]
MNFHELPLRPYLAKRIVATLIDYAIFSLFTCVYIWVFDEDPDVTNMQVTGVAMLPITILWLLYFPLTETLNGATPGHDIMKLKVVLTNGRDISFSVALKRRVCDLIDISTYGIVAVILILKTQKHQRLGDLLANTVVIKKEHSKIVKPVF